MGSNYVDDLIDDGEVPELTADDFKNSLAFSELPSDLQKTLKDIQQGKVTFRPDPARMPVTMSLPADLADRFKEAAGDAWESKVEAALRHWLVEHPLEVKQAKAS